jgi:hypothetical protein
MRAKTINEIQKFERGLDPKRAMGIGLHKTILDACQKLFDINQEEQGEIKINQINLNRWSIAITIAWYNPDYPSVKGYYNKRINKYFQIVFKSLGLEKYISALDNSCSSTNQWETTYSYKFKKEFKGLFNEEGININQMNESIKFERGLNPKKAMGIGINLYNQYLRILEENPELKIYRDEKEIHHFKEKSPTEISIEWAKHHPMSGYQGRTSRMKCWGTIKFIKNVYRVKCFLVEDSGTSDKYFKEFPTMEKALKYIIPDFQSLLSYYSEYSFGK